MKTLGRIAFSLCILLLWIVAIVFGLDLYHALHWQAVDRSNPYLLAKCGQARWPGEEQAAENAGQPAVVAPAAAASLLPEPDSLEEGARRAAFFVGLNEEDRALFAGLYGVSVLVVDAALRGIAMYAPGPAVGATLADFCGHRQEADRRTWFERVFAGGVPEYDPLASGALLAYPARGASGAVEAVFLFREEPVDTASSGPLRAMWERPFFRYKKHATEPDPTNNFGFRDRETVVPKPPGVFRILCIGGSTTEEGDTNDTTYPNLLEARLNAYFPEREIDVVNCGITGLNSIKEKMRLPDYIALEPDLLLFYNGVNDLCHERFPRWVNAAGAVERLVRRSRFLNYHANACLLPSGEAMAKDLDASVLSNFRFMCAYARERGVDMALCSFAYPDIENLTREARQYYDRVCEQEWGGRYVTFASYCRAVRVLNARIQAFCERDSVCYIPVAEELVGGPEYFGDICHMRNAGIGRKAEIVFEALKPYLESRLRPGGGAAAR